MNYYFITAETRDGENEYMHRGVTTAENEAEAAREAYRRFAYDICVSDVNEECRNCPCHLAAPEDYGQFDCECEYHPDDYRITSITGVQKIPQEDFEVLRRYL